MLVGESLSKVVRRELCELHDVVRAFISTDAASNHALALTHSVDPSQASSPPAHSSPPSTEDECGDCRRGSGSTAIAMHLPSFIAAMHLAEGLSALSTHAEAMTALRRAEVCNC